MHAVGKLGSYISRGVVTVAAPFHPFGGAVDIVVVEQEDGTFKSSPWYVQFGKFQGVLKAREKVVTINVNGDDADFRMYLDSRGGAYFLREAAEGEADSGSWGDSPDSISSIRRPKKIMSCNYDLQRSRLVSEFEAGNAKVTRSSSTGPRIFGFVYGGGSEDENALRQREDVIGRNREGSLERAEMAADLLEVKWSTSLATRKQNSDQHLSVNGGIQTPSSVDNDSDTGSKTGSPMRPHSNGFGNNSFRSVSTDEGDTEIPHSTDPDNFMESFTLKEKHFGVNGSSNGGSKSSSAVTLDDVPTVLETKVEVTLDSKTDEGPVKYVTKMVMDQDSVDQDPSLTNSLLIEEATSAALDLMENLRSEKHCCSPSNSTYPGSCEKHDSLVMNVTRNKHESDNCGESNDRKVDGLPEKDDEAQFFFSDIERLEQKIALTVDTEATPVGSLDVENNPQHSPDSSEELDRSSEMVQKPHSFTGELLQVSLPNDHPSSPQLSRTTSSPISIVRDHAQVDQTAPLVDAFSSSWSHGVEINPQDVNHPISRSLDSSFDNMMLVQGDVPTTSENGTQERQTTPRKSSLEECQISEKLKELLSDPAVEISLCRHSVHEGMGYEAATLAFDSKKVDMEKFISLGSDVIKNDQVVVRIGGLYFPWDAALPIVSAIGAPRGEQILEPKGMIRVEQVESAVEIDPQQSMDANNGTWRLWPFKRTMSRRNSVVVDATPRFPGRNTDTLKSNTFRSDTFKSETIKKNVVRKKTPTSDQLESLNLKAGRNEVIFTFSTPMLGEQKVDARIYLWKWNARIVISDVDGTITKSDVLGQFMPMVGVDWSQTGVTHLFSAIKENGYELLFLSARAISQASLTRQFLFNLKQDGKALPEGPVVISPDGLFPSLFREVIRRAPHEFKIACLEDIKALFPLDHHPFYAGFGNRDTDELSYVKVGIPKGKVFIINPKGEVAVQRRVHTKSYTSLHDLVHEMFPHPTSVPPTEKEDYNTWNFWRLPPPDIL